VALAVIGALLVTAAALAATRAGHLDKSFGGGDGIASTRLGPPFRLAGGIAEASRGKIVLGVFTGRGAGDVLRYMRGGRLDHSLGSDGIARLAFRGGYLSPRDVLVDRHNRIVAAGEGFRWSGRWDGGAIARLRPGGHFDPSFSGDGFSLPPPSSHMTPLELAFAPGGKIVLVGLVGGTPSKNVFVARYLPNGRYDRSFSSDGHRVIRVAPAQSSRSVAVDRRGRIVLGSGTLAKPSRRVSWIPTVIRLRADGRLDRSFSGDGRVKVNPTRSDEQLSDVTIDRRGRIIAVSGAGASGSVIRLRPDGRLDRSFSADGKQLVGTITPQSVSVDEKNRIILVGAREGLGDPIANIVRLRPNGRMDGAFNGYVGKMAELTDHFLDSRGRIVAGGSVTRLRVGVARLLNP